ncbi:uncharacterized protein LOC117179929 isoform X2 [Belonocnema kinseyi]|uniref:uncharacterized protein LOC117179929 isoform X2 n=1 Tax=Belonocnema kinseyi TaxID=2817044 RepID=UPI00143D8AB8|nr:uncharacterized protein LOC117179929 isoform X2 [Belonocnema kinseyi]
MSSSMPNDEPDKVVPTSLDEKAKENWVQFEEDSESKITSDLKKDNAFKQGVSATTKSQLVTENVNGISKVVEESNEAHRKSDEYSGAVIPAESVQINLDRSGLNHSISVENYNLSFSEKTGSLKTIDLRDASTNERTNASNVINSSIGYLRQGFVNGDTIVTLLPINTRWPWITPAKFRPELVPEELMAQGLTLTVEDYVHIMELLVNDVRFNMYNICYKRVLVLWIFTGFVILLGLLFSGVTGLTLFSLGVMWLVLNAAAIFLCMFIKIKLNRNLEKCMAQVNKHLLRHKILLGLDDRGKISCHKVNLCYLYFDSADCISKLQEVIELEETGGRAVDEDLGSEARCRQNLQQKMDIDDSDIIIQGSASTRLSRKQARENQCTNPNHLGKRMRTRHDIPLHFLDQTIQGIFKVQEKTGMHHGMQ